MLLFLVLPVELTISPSVTPLTRGKREKNYDESCFVIVFQHEQSSEVSDFDAWFGVAPLGHFEGAVL